MAACAAVGNGKSVCLALLIERGVEVNTKDQMDARALVHHAAIAGDVDCLKILVEKGGDVNQRDRVGATPLYLAARNGHNAAVAFLREAGADSSIASGVRIAAHEGFHSTVEVLQMKDPSRFPIVEKIRGMLRWRRAVEAKRDAAMVFRAASEGRPMELARRLRLGQLAGGLVIYGTLSNGRIGLPIHAAALGGHDECMDVLQGAGSPPLSAVKGCCDPYEVFYAADEGDIAALEKSLRLGQAMGCMSVRRALSNGFYGLPIEAAVLGRHEECVRMLEAAGSPPASIAFEQYCTHDAVFEAARTGDVTRLGKLVWDEGRKKDMSIRYGLPFTGQAVLPIQAAMLNGHKLCVQCLRAAGSPEIGKDYQDILYNYIRLNKGSGN